MRRTASSRRGKRWWRSITARGAEIIVAAYGTVARVVKSVIAQLDKEEGAPKVGLIRPITLWPFPAETFAKAAAQDSCPIL
ncbi:MAG: hypothetical protein ACLR23_15895 [Clostridia bacterium]